MQPNSRHLSCWQCSGALADKIDAGYVMYRYITHRLISASQPSRIKQFDWDDVVTGSMGNMGGPQRHPQHLGVQHCLLITNYAISCLSASRQASKASCRAANSSAVQTVAIICSHIAGTQAGQVAENLPLLSTAVALAEHFEVCA